MTRAEEKTYARGRGCENKSSRVGEKSILFTLIDSEFYFNSRVRVIELDNNFMREKKNKNMYN